MRRRSFTEFLEERVFIFLCDVYSLRQRLSSLSIVPFLDLILNILREILSWVLRQSLVHLRLLLFFHFGNILLALQTIVKLILVGKPWTIRTLRHRVYADRVVGGVPGDWFYVIGGQLCQTVQPFSFNFDLFILFLLAWGGVVLDIANVWHFQSRCAHRWTTVRRLFRLMILSAWFEAGVTHLLVLRLGITISQVKLHLLDGIVSIWNFTFLIGQSAFRLLLLNLLLSILVETERFGIRITIVVVFKQNLLRLGVILDGGWRDVRVRLLRHRLRRQLLQLLCSRGLHLRTINLWLNRCISDVFTFHFGFLGFASLIVVCLVVVFYLVAWDLELCRPRADHYFISTYTNRLLSFGKSSQNLHVFQRLSEVAGRSLNRRLKFGVYF